MNIEAKNYSMMSFEELKYVADRGDAEAQYIIGNYYRFGVKVRSNRDEAVNYYRKSALQDNVDAMYTPFILAKTG